MCGECGKPHDRDDPPCENCGAMVFEPAVVRADTVESTNVDWRCERCGKHHVKNSPPCSSCGHMQFERVELSDLGPDEIGSGWSVDFGTVVAGVVVVLIVVGVAYVLV